MESLNFDEVLQHQRSTLTWVICPSSCEVALISLWNNVVGCTTNTDILYHIQKPLCAENWVEVNLFFKLLFRILLVIILFFKVCTEIKPTSLLVQNWQNLPLQTQGAILNPKNPFIIKIYTATEAQPIIVKMLQQGENYLLQTDDDMSLFLSSEQLPLLLGR